MTLRLQTFDFRKSPYERPTHTWVCGRTGDPCRIGPDGRGRCRAVAECRPRKDGERWVCTRARDQGGACAEGPRPNGSCAHPIPPCQPVRSVRAKRGLVTRWATALAIGFVALALAGEHRERAISPGQLTAEHAEVPGCAGCHQSGDRGPAGLTRAALAGVPPPHAGDSRQCLDCHQMGEQPFAPHGADSLPEPAVDADGPRPQLPDPQSLHLASQTFAEPDQTGAGVGCAACHKEHQGADADLSAMSDARCQSCHTRKFTSLSDGHPKFGAYPYTRRTRLNFDHVGHARQHFADADAPAPETCTACHVPDQAGRVMRVKGFQTSCADCHAGEIRGMNMAGSPGLPVLAVPGLDLPTLREQGVGIGAWPELADGELTPFMRVVLAGREGVDAATLARFRALDAMDLRQASAAELEAVQRVAWAVKRLVYDLTAEGPKSLMPALEASLGGRLSDATVRAMLGALPHDTVRAAQREWFPDLAAELARRDAGQPVPIPGGEPAADAGADAGASGSGDAAADGDQSGAILGGEDGEDGSGGSDDSILSGGETDGGGDLMGGGSDAQGGQSGGQSGGESILGGSDSGGGSDTGGDILSGEDTGGGSDGGDILSGGETDGGSDLLGGGQTGADDTGQQAESEAPADKAEMPEPRPSDWAEMGGWYRDFYVLYYRPTDHADGFVRHWLDATAPMTGPAAADASAAGTGAAGAVFERLAQPKAPGRCVKCHSVDRRADGPGLRVNWQGRTTGASGTRLTGFRHAPHLTLTAGEQGCATCHKFDREADYLASFDDRDPHSFASNFQPVNKATCTDCHTDQLAGDACTTCHAYHADQPTSMPVKTDMAGVTDGGS